MNLKNLTLIGAALLLSSPVFGSTYYGGFEDTKGGDYDYNDIVFSLSGNGLTLNSTANWYNQPTLDNNGHPFWDNSSADGSKLNIGYCIYGGGACNGGTALDSGAKFLASNANSRSGSADNVTFSVSGAVSTDVYLKISSATDTLGYYLLSDPNKSFRSLTATNTANVYTFSPASDFGLIGLVNGTTKYYSQTFLGASDDVSHFAFFSGPETAPAPEPGEMSLMGVGLLSVGVLFRRRKASQK